MLFFFFFFFFQAEDGIRDIGVTGVQTCALPIYALYEINKQIVISSDRPPKEIPTLEDRLRSRFEQGLLADIQPPDFETRLAILRSKLSANANLVSEAGATVIPHQGEKNIRGLGGALTPLL